MNDALPSKIAPGDLTSADLAIVDSLRRGYIEVIESYDHYAPAVEAGVDGSSEEYVIPNHYVSYGTYRTLEIEALRALTGVDAVPYSEDDEHSPDNRLAALLRDETLRGLYPRAQAIVALAVEPTVTEHRQARGEAFEQARLRFQADRRLAAHQGRHYEDDDCYRRPSVVGPGRVAGI